MRRNRGSVALEFLFVFPLVVALLYAAATYGVLFFSKYEMQSVVDQAAATALRVDRNRYSAANLSEQVVAMANTTIEQEMASLSSRLRESVGGEEASGCAVTLVDEVELLQCVLTLDNRASPLVPQFSFGLLGQFPPLPDSITVKASAAF